jgi:hypothetical protein
MPFVRINGLPIEVDYGSWREEAVHVGDLFERSLAARLCETRIARLRRWKCRTTPTGANAPPTPAESALLERWIEGHGHSFAFDSSVHSFSAAGVTNSASPGATLTRSTTGGKYGGRLNIGAGGVFGVDFRNKSYSTAGWLPEKGWTVFAWRNFVASETASAGYHHVLIKGAVAFSRGSAANPVGVKQYIDGVLNASANLGRVFSVHSVDPWVGIWGYTTNNTTVAIDWDELVFLPYEVPDSWVASIYDTHSARAWSRLPRVQVDGDYMTGGVVEALARVEGAAAEQVATPAGLQNALRAYDLRIEEWA